MKTTAETARTIDLGYEQLFLFDGGPQARLRVLYGATWLTEEGEPGDVVVRAGHEVALRRGRALIEGLGPTRVQIVETQHRNVVQRVVQKLRRSAREGQRLLERLQVRRARSR